MGPFKTFLKYFAAISLANVAGTAIIAFSLFRSFGEKISYQGGLAGHIAASLIVAWMFFITGFVVPTAISASVLTYVKHRKENKTK